MRIYQQSLLLDRVVDTGDSSTTMMTADVERVQLGVRKIHDAWASFVSVAIGLWLIEAQLGLAALVTLGLIGGGSIYHCYGGELTVDRFLAAWWVLVWTR
jgi:hypothetical protein